MPDGNENPATATVESTEAAPAQQPTISFTPEQLAWIEAEKAKERNAGAAAARKAIEGKQKPKAEPPKPVTQATESSASQPSPVDDFDQLFEQRLAIESLAQGIASHGLNAKQADAIKTLYKAEKPGDVSDWVKQKVADLGFTKTPNPAQVAQSSAAPNTAPVQTQPATPPIPAPAPASTNLTAPPSDVLRWSKDMVDAKMRTVAKVPQDLYHPANREAWRQAKSMAMAALASVRVIPKEE